MWIWLSTTYFTCRLEINASGIVTETAPICKWAKGKHYDAVIDYYQKKKVLLKYEVINEKSMV